MRGPLSNALSDVFLCISVSVGMSSDDSGVRIYGRCGAIIHQSGFLLESIESAKRHHFLEYSGIQYTERNHKLDSLFDVPSPAMICSSSC